MTSTYQGLPMGYGTPLHAKKNSKYLQEPPKQLEVSVDDKVAIFVKKEEGEDTCRIVDVRGNTISGNLRPGQFLVGAGLGSAKVSFVKLPKVLVEKELTKLKSIKKPYTLYVTEGSAVPSSLVTSPNPESDFFSPERAGMQPPSRTSAQELTPPPRFQFGTEKPKNGGSSLKYEQNIKPETSTAIISKPHDDQHHADHHENNDAFAAMMQWDDLHRVQTSLEKLRGQRVAMERLKVENEKKDAQIKELTSRNSKLRDQLTTAQETVDAQARLFGDLEVAAEKVNVLEQKLAEKLKELETVKESGRAAEAFLHSSLDQEKQRNEDLIVEHQRLEETLREELESVKIDAQNEALKVKRLEGDLNQIQKELNDANEMFEDFRAKQAEKYASLQRSLAAVEQERDDLFEQQRALQSQYSSQGATLKSTMQALESAESRAKLLSGTVEELEENAVMLRKQILEVEKRHATSTQDLNARIKSADHMLAQKSAEIADLGRELTKYKDELKDEVAAHKLSKGTLARKDKELENYAESLKTLTGKHRATQARLAEATTKIDMLHEKMLQERKHSASLAQKLDAERRKCREWAHARLDLLNQFCEEEERFRKLS